MEASASVSKSNKIYLGILFIACAFVTAIVKVEDESLHEKDALITTHKKTNTTIRTDQHDILEKTQSTPDISLSQNVSLSVDDGKSRTESLCWRKCPQRLHRIYYNDPGAGLSDRRWVIHTLAELAGYLCAKLVLPRPVNLLHTKHNFGGSVSEHLLWEDFYNITFAEDDEPAIVDINDEFDDVDRKRNSSIGWYSREHPTWHEKYQGYQRIVSVNGKWKKDFKTVQALSWRNSIPNTTSAVTAFVWELHGKFYWNDLNFKKLPRLSKMLRSKLGGAYKPNMMEPIPHLNTSRACHYTNEDNTPSHISLLQEKLINRVYDNSLLENSIYGVLHLRRGDSIDDCDTSVDRIREYLSCSLENTDLIGNITLLMKSDEVDKRYRQEIVGLADTYGHVNILDLDGLIWKIVHQAGADGDINDYHVNNYFVYAIGNMFRTRLIQFYLERRKKNYCLDCIPVENQLREILGI
uniref:O-fucosyltransferase family protein n=1 Tax=Ditylum brightwellii TaxID=49249 RepID=A0A7S1Z432_9STRA|mmetsp:Transcript_2364/g.3695  ORF Transcript_2364/g.3695 Transcript_2364/m.3695 type:complete len:466 (+) Transcript_2364:164-1561(+)